MEAREYLIEYLARFGGCYGQRDIAEQEASGILAELEKCGWAKQGESNWQILAIDYKQQCDALQRQLDALNAAFDPRRWTAEMNDAWHRAIPDIHKAFADLHVAAIQAGMEPT